MRFRTAAHLRTPAQRFSSAFQRIGVGWALAVRADVIWFLEKQDDLLVCEIRKADDETVYVSNTKSVNEGG